MQRENLINVLMYVFENYYEPGHFIDTKTKHITEDMLKAGFEEKSIAQALLWFKELNATKKAFQTHKNFLGKTSFRVLTHFEDNKMTAEARSGLLFLEQIGIVDPLTREIILDRAMTLAQPVIDLQELKWITLMVLFSQKRKRHELMLTESLILHTGFFTGNETICH